MKVSVSRTGGVAGIRRQWAVELDDRPDRDDWEPLLERIRKEDPPASGSGPDRFSYVIRIESREVRVGESALSGPWRELVDRVRTSGG